MVVGFYMCLWNKVSQKDENLDSFISWGDAEIGFEYAEFEVLVGYLGIDVLWEVRDIVWNFGDGFG